MPTQKNTTWFRTLLRNFLTGLVILIPLIITIAIIAWVFNFLNNTIGLQSFLGKLLRSVDFIPHISEWFIVVLGYLVVILVIALVGRTITQAKSKNQVSQKISKAIGKIPVINKIYSSIEQLWDFLFHKKAKGLSKFGAVVIFNFANVKTFGLLASHKKFILKGKEHLLVFMPSSPIPATGFNYFIPVSDVHTCDIPLEKFAKVHLSLGVMAGQIFPHDLGLKKFCAKNLCKKRKK